MRGCCAEQACCCVGDSPCSTPCLPPVKESTSTRLLYILLFTCGTVLCCVMVSQTVADQLPQYPTVVEFCNTTLYVGESCGKLVGYVAVYRICFAMAAFFLIFTVLTIGTRSSNSCMANVHNGIWLFKVLGFVGLIIGVWFVPSERIVLDVALYIGFVGAALFIFMQLWLLIDFATSWNSKWSYKALRENKCWYVALIVFTTIFYIATAGLIYICARLFGASLDCIINLYFIGASILLCIFILFLTLATCYKKELRSRNGLLQASIVSSYVMYLTWSAFLVEPAIQVNTQIGINQTTNETIYNTTTAVCGPISFTTSFMEGSTGELINSIFAALLMLGMVLYACCWIGMHPKKKRKKMSRAKREVGNFDPGFWCCSSHEEESPADAEIRHRGWGLIRNEADGTVYNYSLFHLTFVLASFYIMMTLTNWYQPEEASLESLHRTWPPFWVRLGSAWLCGVLYIVKLFFVTCCGSRSDYHQTPTRDEPADPRVI